MAISRFSERNKLLPGFPPDVNICGFALLHCGAERDVSALWRIVVAHPDFHVRGQGVQLFYALPQGLCAAAGKIAASCAYIWHKQSITDKYVIPYDKAHAVTGMARCVYGRNLGVSECQCIAVFEQEVKGEIATVWIRQGLKHRSKMRLCPGNAFAYCGFRSGFLL